MLACNKYLYDCLYSLFGHKRLKQSKESRIQSATEFILRQYVYFSDKQNQCFKVYFQSLKTELCLKSKSKLNPIKIPNVPIQEFSLPFELYFQLKPCIVSTGVSDCDLSTTGLWNCSGVVIFILVWTMAFMISVISSIHTLDDILVEERMLPGVVLVFEMFGQK